MLIRQNSLAKTIKSLTPLVRRQCVGVWISFSNLYKLLSCQDMRTEAMLNPKIKPIALVSSIVIFLASFAGSVQPVRYSHPVNQELAFLQKIRRRVFSYAPGFNRRFHRPIHSFTDSSIAFKFFLLNIRILIERQINAWNVTPHLAYFIHQPIFSIDSPDEDASFASL